MAMNCDQVFDVLTQGPFPRGRADDSAVEAHLADCPDCRRMAMALRPAVTLFHETLSENESSCLPGYWGRLLEESPAAECEGGCACSCGGVPADAEESAPAPRVRERRGSAAGLRAGLAAASFGKRRLLQRAMAVMCLAAVGGAAFLPYGKTPPTPLAQRTPRFTAPAPRVVEGDLLWAAAGVPNCAATPPAAGWDFQDVPADGPGAPLAVAAGWRPQPVAWQGAKPAELRVAKPPRSVVFASTSAAHRGDPALLALYCCTHCHRESPQPALLAASPAPQAAQACLLCHDSEP